MADPKARAVLADLRAGRNAYDPAWAIADEECADAVNVDFHKARIGNKRGGMSAPSWTNVTRTGTTSSLYRHVPTTDETLAELWAVDDAATPIIERLTGGLAWAAPTLKDAPTGNGWDFTFASLNGKLFMAYKSAVNRLHVWDPVSNSVRRTGLAATAAPTAANTGAGTYAAVLRYYRQRSTVQIAGVTVRRSEPSPSVTFTPSGTGTHARVTQAAVINEGETHWEVEASTDNVTFYRIATVLIATTTYDDNALTTTYSAGTLSATTGTYTLQKSYKFLAADQNRLLGFGAYTATDKQNRIEFSAVLGSLDVGDDERVDTSLVNSYLDLDENDSGVPTGLCGPVFGGYFAFKDRQVWQLTPTGTTSLPYRQQAISKSIGAVAHYAIARGDDALGNSALYWMSHRGPYRWSILGLEYLGRGIEDFIQGPTATIFLAATKVVARTLYHADKRQVWCWVATGSSNDPNQLFLYDVQTGGWSRVPTGDLLANVRCATLFANTLGAAMSRDLKPYVGQTGAVTRLWKADTGTDDNGTPYQAYVVTKALEPGGPGFYGSVGDAVLLAKAGTSVTITATVTADFGIQTTSGTALLTASGSETRVSKTLEGSGLAGVSFVQYQLGDASAISNSWTLDRLTLPLGQSEAVSG
jgi:hypothetical protein